MRNRLFLLLLFVLAAAVFVSCNQDAESKTFTVTFMANDEGATGEMSPQKVERYVSESLAANKFTKEGWAFKSWNTKADGTGNAYFDKSTIRLAKDITLYAQWEYNQVTVTFNANGGTGDMPAQKVTKKESTPLNANTFTRDNGYVFNGWNTKADGTGESYADKTNVTLSADLTLYAQWYHDQVTVTFHPNGGVGEVKTQKVNTNIPTDLDSVGYTKESYQLAYWTTNPDGTGTRYGKYGPVSINENISLYAQWIDADYKIMDSSTTMIGGGLRYTIVDDLTINDRIVAYYGGATLVLPPGLTLTLPKGIYVNAGYLGALTIQGAGTLIATGLDGNAAIGGDNEAACGPITISGGNIIATGGPDGAAGIGGGYGSACGTITINGGIITATGGFAELGGFGAGIGGGAGSVDEGTVSFGTNLVEVSENGSDWSAYDEIHRKRYMRVNHVI